MVTKQQLEEFVVSSGLWEGTRRQTHSFLLSPDVLEITCFEAEALQQLAEALHDCMGGLGRIATIASTPMGHGQTWGMIHRALNTGVPDYYRKIQYLNPSCGPVVCKVDFMIGRVSESGEDRHRWAIAEIDGHNKHGMGYSTIARMLRDQVHTNAKGFPGVVALLKKAIRNKNEGGSDCLMIYGDQERFYLPEMLLLQKALADEGIRLAVLSEMEIEVGNNYLYADGHAVPQHLLVDFPFLYRNHDLIAALIKGYQEEQFDFLLPPKPFLGSKATMALLRNDERIPELEAILHSQIPATSLELLRRYIPPTYLVGKHKPKQYWWAKLGEKPHVLKGSISSGMKRTVFADETAAHRQAFEHACDSYYHYVAQQEFRNSPFPFRYYDEDGELCSDDWFLRATVHFSLRSVADIIVTARRDKKVHGGKDCLQLGTVIVPDPPGQAVTPRTWQLGDDDF